MTALLAGDVALTAPLSRCPTTHVDVFCCICFFCSFQMQVKCEIGLESRAVSKNSKGLVFQDRIHAMHVNFIALWRRVEEDM